MKFRHCIPFVGFAIAFKSTLEAWMEMDRSYSGISAAKHDRCERIQEKAFLVSVGLPIASGVAYWLFVVKGV